MRGKGGGYSWGRFIMCKHRVWRELYVGVKKSILKNKKNKLH